MSKGNFVGFQQKIEIPEGFELLEINDEIESSLGKDELFSWLSKSESISQWFYIVLRCFTQVWLTRVLRSFTRFYAGFIVRGFIRFYTVLHGFTRFFCYTVLHGFTRVLLASQIV